MVLKMIRRSFLRSFLLQHPPKGVLQTNAIILGLSIFRDVRRSLGMMAAGVLVLVALLVGEAQSDAGGGLASLVTTPERRERTNHGVVEGHAPFAGWGVEGPEPSRETGLWVGSEAAPESADTAEAEQTATAEPAGETRCGAGGCLVATRYGDGRLKADGSHEIDFNGLPPWAAGLAPPIPSTKTGCTTPTTPQFSPPRRQDARSGPAAPGCAFASCSRLRATESLHSAASR